MSNKAIKIKVATSIFILLFVFRMSSFSQVGGDEVDVISKFRPVLKESEKMMVQPLISDTFFTPPNLVYQIEPRPINIAYIPDTIAAARMKGEPIKKLNRVLLKMGYGNYNTPLGEVWVNSLRHKTTAYNVHLKHFSSSGNIPDVGFPGVSDNIAQVGFKNVLSGFTLYSNASYERNAYHFYGFNTQDTTFEKAEIKQVFNRFKINFAAETNHGKDSARWNQRYSLDAYTTGDNYFSRETAVLTKLDLNRYFKGQFIGVRFGTWFYNTSSNLNPFNQFFTNINPYVKFGGRKWNAEVGLDPYLVTDEDASSFALRPIIYPKVHFSFDVYEHYLTFYGGITGYTERNSFEQLRQNNPFVFMAQPNLRNSNHRYIFDGGMRGALSKRITYNLNANFRRVENLAFFFNDTTRGVGNFFNVIYDNTDVLNVNGELAYQSSNKWHFRLKSNFYNYQPDIQREAWHLHTFDLTFSGRYNLSDKILINTDFYLINQRKAPIFDPGVVGGVTSVELPAMVDVNFGAEYRYSKFLSLFLNANNVVSNRFVRWNNYPTQTFNILGGITFGF